MAVLLNPSFAFENAHAYPVVGVDEVGCGAWAGPVIAAAVHIHPECPRNFLALLNDSKRLSLAQRETAFSYIIGRSDLFIIGIGEGTLEDIGKYNIRGASLRAMGQAVGALQEKLETPIGCVLVDGRSKPDVPGLVECIVKGDQQSYSIAAASIVAKVTRDRLMAALGARYPLYGWERNVGYGTPAHKTALRQWGPTNHHRATFKPIQKFIDL